jgi:hypothetical protein
LLYTEDVAKAEDEYVGNGSGDGVGADGVILGATGGGGGGMGEYCKALPVTVPKPVPVLDLGFTASSTGAVDLRCRNSRRYSSCKRRAYSASDTRLLGFGTDVEVGLLWPLLPLV